MNTKSRVVLLLAVNFIVLSNINAQGQAQSQKNEKQPLIYGLIIDNSESLRSQIDKVIAAGKFVVNSNKSGDQTFIVRFVDSGNIKVIQSLTSDKAAFQSALESMYVERGASSIIDAVYFSAQRLVENDKATNLADQRILILITDGDERSSYYKLDRLLSLLREKNIKVYVIGFTEALQQQGENTQEKAVGFLNKLAGESGGRAFFPNSMSEVKSISDGLLDEIRKQK